jgi:hypothetical protein
VPLHPDLVGGAEPPDERLGNFAASASAGSGGTKPVKSDSNATLGLMIGVTSSSDPPFRRADIIPRVPPVPLLPR